jgi:hypothetical protein
MRPVESRTEPRTHATPSLPELRELARASPPSKIRAKHSPDAPSTDPAPDLTPAFDVARILINPEPATPAVARLATQSSSPLASPTEPVGAERPRDATPATPAAGTPPKLPSPEPRATTAKLRGGVFSGLRAIAQALTGRADASRALGEADHVPSRVPAAHWFARLESVASFAKSAERESAEAQAAAVSTPERPTAVARRVLATDELRLGTLARAAQAYLAMVVAGRAAEKLEAPFTPAARRFGERLLARASGLDDVAALASQGLTPPQTVVDSAIAAASSEVTTFFHTLPGGASRLAKLGFSSLLESVSIVEQTLDGRAQLPTQGAHETDAESEGQLKRAAAQIEATASESADSAPYAPSASVSPAAKDPSIDTDGTRPPATSPRRNDARPRREHAAWEFVAPEAATFVELSDIVRTLRLERAERLRDVLAEGLRSKNQFVIWRRPSTRLSAEIEQLVSNGLIETRVLRA